MTAQPSLFQRLTGLFTALRPPQPKRSRVETDTELLERLFRDFDSKADVLARGLSDGRLSVDDWANAMRTLIRQQHLAAAVIGSGGTEAATPETAATAQRSVNTQMTYFQRWVDDLKAGKVGSEKQIAARAKLYARAAGATASQALVNATGVPPLPFYPKSGNLRCRSNCRCSIEVVTTDVVNSSYDVYWKLDHAKHETCPDCVRLSREWNPLRIRGGKILGS